MIADVKMLIEESDWVTYVGITNYPRPDYNEKGYRDEAQTADPIWRIMKIEESDGVTEISYPDWDCSAKFVWDDRASLNYI